MDKVLKEIMIDASTICQLKCPSCFHSKSTDNVLGKGFLKKDDFRLFLSANNKIKKVELSNFGEIFLNPDIKEIVRLAYESNVLLTAFHGTNFNHVDDEILEYLVKYKFHGITVSIDGASEDIYSIYRIGGSFNKVIENINKLNYFKRKYKSEFPRLRWQFVVFGHNEHELLVAKEKAKELKMEFYPKKTWDEKFSPIKNKEFVLKHTNWKESARSEYSKKDYLKNMQKVCLQLWLRPQVNWDGKLLGCCKNTWGYFHENIFEVPLDIVFTSEKLTYAKKMLLGETECRDDIPCTHCKIYQDMKNNDIWIDDNDFPKEVEK